MDELQGFVIMAYRAQGATGFYDSRVVYVTFHENLEERPEFLAWVDLSKGQILKATEDSMERHASNEGRTNEGRANEERVSTSTSETGGQ